ncbi:MAG: DUF3179 domain-containing protein [Bacteroidota bacterium]
MRLLLLALALALPVAGCAQAPSPEAEQALPGFATNTAQRTIDLSELMSGGPPKDGIPSIDAPQFVSAEAASGWLAPQEPVILLEVGDEAKFYPLQILTWHEIANDTLGGRPVAVTFCPLCYSAVAFDRRVETGGETRTLSLGVSGMLRFSDMVIYDRQTETLWQQFTGEALVGDLVGTTLEILPAQIVSFAQARAAHPEAPVLSRETGHARDYGRNPYAGYDDVGARPFAFRGPEDGRLPPMARVAAVEVETASGPAFRAYPASVTRERRVVHDTLGGQRIVVFHADGATTALGAAQIAEAREVGTTGAFRPEAAVDGETTALTFRYDNGAFVDDQTGSRWRVTGEATAGPLAGAELAPVLHHDTFAFAWFAFRPETTVYAE